MKSLLAKVALHKAIGVHLGEHEVAVSKVAFTLLGPVEIASASETYSHESLTNVLERVLKPLLSEKRRIPVAIGLPTSRVFFGTRLTRTGAEITAESVLQKAFASPNIRVDDLTVDLTMGTVNKMPVASVAACRKKYMAGIINHLTHLGVRPFCTEPEANAMVRAAMEQHRFPRRAKTILCIFLGGSHGLAVLVAGGQTLAWRQFMTPEASESLSIISAARTLETQQRHFGIEAKPDYALVFGQPDLHERLRKEQFPSDLGTRVIWHEGPGLSSASCAFGLALGCAAASDEGLDLSRHLKSRPSIAEIFPWGDLAFVTLLVLGMGGVLGFHYTELNSECTRLQVECCQHPCLAANAVGQLEKDEREMRERITAVGKFLDSRIAWTAYAKNLADRLPGKVRITSMTGINSMGGKKGAGKRELLLNATAQLPENGTMPHDIDVLMNELRNDKTLRRDFPVVEISDIRGSETHARGAMPEATFSIRCLPIGKGGKKRR